MGLIIPVLSSSALAALIAWLVQRWLSERLRQSIQHEYSQKLEAYKADLNTRIQSLQHENQLLQLKTSLFFDHQRQAFAGILAKIAEVNRIWIEKEYHGPDEGLSGPVPYTAYQELRTVYYQHQLFLDPFCLAAMELIFECYSDSFDDAFEPTTAQRRSYDAAYGATEYLQPRLAELFRSRIGVTAPGHGEREIALLGSIRLLNRYNFAEINLPPKGPLKLVDWEGAAEVVAKAEDNFQELVSRLKQFQGFLKHDNGFFHEAAAKTTQYLTVLAKEQQAEKA